MTRLVSVFAPLFVVLSAPVVATAQDSPTTVSPDGYGVLVSKDINGERWAINRDLERLTVTGNVFSPGRDDPNFVWCDQTGTDGSDLLYSCSGTGSCGSVGCSGQWTGLGPVRLSRSFFGVGAPGPSGLDGLVGAWRFYYRVISTFDREYEFQRKVTVDGTEVLQGEGPLGRTVVAARVQDLNPGSTLPWEFSSLERSSSYCTYFVFNREADQVLGVYFLLDSTASGCDTSDIGSPRDMNGVRLPSVVAVRSGQQDEAIQTLEAVAEGLAGDPTIVLTEDQRAEILAGIDRLAGE